MMTRRSRSKAMLVLAALAAGLGTTPAARATPERPRPSHLEGTAEELAGWQALEEGRYIRAREIGDKLVRDNPASFAGHYVLGAAMHYGEGDLARAVYHLEEAAGLFERRYGPRPEDTAPWRWHEATLRELAYVLNEIDRPADELVVLDRYDAAYLPKRIAHRIWPLMKLRRYDEARTAAKLAMAGEAADQKIIARSDLCAAECEAGDREAAYKACTAALDPFRARSSGGQVEYSNASESALSVFRFDVAERFLSESTRRATGDSWGNPYQHLANLYTTEGRIPEAIEALKGGQELRMRRPAWLDQHGQARLDWTVAALLVVVGQTERAVQIAERAEAHPDRQGVHSGTEAQANAAYRVLLQLARREQAARDAEDAVTSGFWQGIKLRLRSWGGRFAAWRDGRRAAVLFSDEEFLGRTLRPYYVGGADIAEWMVPEVVDLVGAGVALEAIAEARKVERFGASPSYFDAFEAEAWFQRGDEDRALEMAEKALKGLPHAEVLLQGRMAAIAAESARRLGEAERALGHFATALGRDPDVLRRLDIPLPVTVEADGSEAGQIAAALVERSPRFRTGEAGHFVSIQGGEGAESACLLGPRHEMIQCARIKPDQGASPKERARKLVAELHRVAFAFKADLSQADLTTLDGSPTAARADRQVKSLLDTLGEPASPAGAGTGAGTGDDDPR